MDDYKRTLLMNLDRLMDTLMDDTPFAPHVVCTDGFTMSVQSRPSSDSVAGESAEVGYPSEMEPLLMPYAEDAARPTNTVYAFVPLTIIDAVIAKHGGKVTSA